MLNFVSQPILHVAYEPSQFTRSQRLPARQSDRPPIQLLATAALSVHPTDVEAASNECKGWYYRANRINQSRCWFLSSRNVRVHSRLSQTTPVTRSHFIRPNTAEVPVAQQDREIGPRIASAIEPAEDQLALGQTIVPQVAPDLPRSDELLARKVATIPYRLWAYDCDAAKRRFGSWPRAGKS